MTAAHFFFFFQSSFRSSGRKSQGCSAQPRSVPSSQQTTASISESLSGPAHRVLALRENSARHFPDTPRDTDWARAKRKARRGEVQSQGSSSAPPEEGGDPGGERTPLAARLTNTSRMRQQDAFLQQAAATGNAPYNLRYARSALAAAFVESCGC